MLRQDRRVPRGEEDDRPRVSRPGRGRASLRARDVARRRRPCRGGHTARRRHRDHRHPGPGVRLPPEGPPVPRHRHVTRGRRGTATAPLGVPMTRLISLIAAALLVAGCVTSQNEPGRAPTASGSIEAYLAGLNDDNFSGVVMVAKDFVPFATRATGYADRGRGAPNATITPCNIAEITKLFTAVAIGQLVDHAK